MGGTTGGPLTGSAPNNARHYPSQATDMDKNNELRRLKAEFVTAAKRVMDAIQRHGVNSEIFLKANADFEALVERIKSLTGGTQIRAGKPN